MLIESIALAIQALFFGDGGILAYGANTFNMAFVMPMVGYAVYLMTTRNTALTARRRAIGAGIAGYVGLNAAAIIAYWDGDIDTAELIQSLKPLPPRP